MVRVIKFCQGTSHCLPTLILHGSNTININWSESREKINCDIFSGIDIIYGKVSDGNFGNCWMKPYIPTQAILVVDLTSFPNLL